MLMNEWNVMQFLKGINIRREEKNNFSATTSEKGLDNFMVPFVALPYCISNWQLYVKCFVKGWISVFYAGFSQIMIPYEFIWKKRS